VAAVGVFVTPVLFVVLFTDGMQDDPPAPDRVAAARTGAPVRVPANPRPDRGRREDRARAALGRRLRRGGGPGADGPRVGPGDRGRGSVPFRLQHLLNVESGLNDGLALPVPIVMLAVAHDEPVVVATSPGGCCWGWGWASRSRGLAIRLIGLRAIAPAKLYEPIAVVRASFERFGELAIEVALLGSSLDPRERIVAAWFGPEGFASVATAS
jgi:hypothetical protein